MSSSMIESRVDSFGVAFLFLNNTEMRNALISELIEELVLTLEKWNFDNSVKVVILSGRGKSFCAGGDIKAMKECSGMFSGDSSELMQHYQSGIQKIPKAMEQFRKPIIGAINGAAIGAGCDLATMCDIRIGTSQTKMGETFTKLGLVPGDGGTFFLSRVVGYAKAMEMFLTAKIYSANECLSMGLLNEVVPDEKNLLERAEEMALEILKNSAVAVELTKSALKAARLSDLQSQLDTLSAYQGIAQRLPDHFKRLP